MKHKNLKFAALSAAALVVCVPLAQAQLVNQPYDFTGNLYASQDDTSAGGFGQYATTYDDFTISQNSYMNGVTWVGGYFNPGPPGAISSFDLDFYSDNAGSPGALFAFGNFGGNANETDMGGGIDSYSVAFLPYFLAPGTYWLSISAEMPYPPQWGWGTSGVGNNNGYQTFFGSTTATGQNNAFTIEGFATPEPMTVIPFGLGLGLLALGRRRKSK